MRVFIIGAGGFIGGHVAAGLSARGHDIHALAHTEQQLLHFKALGYTPVFGNMLHDESWRTDAARAEGLINCGQLTLGLRHGQRWLEAATQAEQQVTKALLRAALAGDHCQSLIDTSGLSALGDQGEAWVDEDTVPASSPMGTLHLAGEGLLQAAAYDSGVPGCTLRLGMVYSPDGPFADHFLLRGSHGRIPIIGDGQNWLSPVHVDDVVEAYAQLLQQPQPGKVLHVCDDEPVRMQTFAERVLGCFEGGEVVHVPPSVVSLFAGPPIAQMSLASARSGNDAIREALGWSPRFAESWAGLKDVVARWKAGQPAD